MSMSQEEIESLMTGLDIVDDETSEDEKVQEDNTLLNTDEIEELISQTEEINAENLTNDTEKENIESQEVSTENNIESSIDNKTNDTSKLEEAISSSQEIKNDDIDDLLKDIEVDSSSSSETIEENDIEEMLSSTNDTPIEELKEEEKVIIEDLPVDNEDAGRDWTDSKINEGIFPLPAEKDTKVVSQLTEVANDSEEKVSQIFDVLSLALDNNGETKKSISNAEKFIISQTKLLESLNSKFPNIEVFKVHLKESNEMAEELSKLKNTLNDEDNEIFSAMELMQFNDINRQKIERVMAVIRKLTLYLNNLFEDDGQRDIAVAKHIHGDHSDDLIGDDLDKLIEEFNN